MYDFLDKIGLKAVLEAIKGKIPTSLPANGGNADTVDDYHVSDVIYSSASKPPQYFTDVARINPETKRIERWNTDNIKVALADRATNAGNANTVNGHTVNTDVPNIAFSQTLDSGYSATSALNDGTYYCTNWTDYPSNALDAQGTLIVTNYATSNTYPWSHRTFYSPHSPNIWHGFTANGVWYGWNEISTTPIKSEEFTASTDEWSHIQLFSTSENKKPLAVIFVNTPRTYSVFSHGGYCYLELYNNSMQTIPNTSVSFVLYYMEV